MCLSYCDYLAKYGLGCDKFEETEKATVIHASRALSSEPLSKMLANY
jgi:hypothetical protein